MPVRHQPGSYYSSTRNYNSTCCFKRTQIEGDPEQRVEEKTGNSETENN